jgi:hypothetical protein
MRPRLCPNPKLDRSRLVTNDSSFHAFSSQLILSCRSTEKKILTAPCMAN